MPCWIKIHHTGSPASATTTYKKYAMVIFLVIEDIEVHHGVDEGYNVIRMLINEVGAILNIVLWNSIVRTSYQR